jgi:hypothetical protein
LVFLQALTGKAGSRVAWASRSRADEEEEDDKDGDHDESGEDPPEPALDGYTPTYGPAVGGRLAPTEA